jgi:PBSX family phage terminase large subunit
MLGLLRDKTASAVVMSKVGNTLNDSVVKQIMWAAEALGASGEWRYNPSRLAMKRAKTGQEILFRGIDDPLKLKSMKPALGQNFRYAWYEELAEFYGMDEIDQVNLSLNRGGGAFQAFYSYNPPNSASSWVNQESLVPRSDRTTLSTSYLDMPREWLGEEFIAEAERTREVNERRYRHVFMGDVLGTGGQVFDNVEARTVTKAETDAAGRQYWGLDFGFAVDPDAMVCCAYNKALDTLYVVDEIYARGQSLETLAERISSKAGKAYITCDSEDPRMIDSLKRRGVNALPAKKGPGSIEHGIRWIAERAAVVIDPMKAPNAAREFLGLEYDQDRQGRYMARVRAKDDHTVDACRYAVEELSRERQIKVINKARLGF